MNDNSLVTIHKWLEDASRRLKTAGIDSHSLDALILVEHLTGYNRAHILAHQELTLTPSQLEKANKCLDRRAKREPLAYILGNIEFYGRNFMVNKHVLVPRPESEAIIEILHSLPITPGQHLVDVGTGSGILGISAKLEFPTLDVTLSDVSRPALDVAAQNARILKAEVHSLHSNLLDAFLSTPQARFDIIVANLPYIDHSWPTSPELQHEPQDALFAEDNGLELIKRLIAQSSNILSSSGYLVLEADPSQFSEIITFSRGHDLTERTRNGYCLVLKKS